MHRLLLTSSTYRQGAAHGVDRDRAARAVALFGARAPRRLEAELIRDASLAASGELVPSMEGPSEESDRLRRAVYVQLKRNKPAPLLGVFDLPDGSESCARRNVTTTAPQALLFLNNAWVVARAGAFAERVREEDSDGAWAPAQVPRRAYRFAFGREQSNAETAAAVGFLDGQSAEIAATLGDAETPQEEARVAALVDFCHVLLGSSEFVYVD